jgi:multiple sugar transport system ATP-binding protein
MSALRLCGLTKHFGPVPAVVDVSLETSPGEIFVLSGPSGCGKTTLLRLIAGLEVPDAGRIYLGTRELTGEPPHRRGVGMLFQFPAVYPFLSVRKNLAFGLGRRYNSTMRGGDKPAAEPEQGVIAMARLLGLEQLLDRRALELSGGERQRVALGRVLLRQPAVFLLDEPLAHVELTGRERLRWELRDLLQQTAACTVWVTHDPAEAFAVADRLAVMQAGRILQVGTPREICEQPQSLAVARLVGDPPMNLIAAGRLNVGLGGGNRVWGVRAQDIRLGPPGFLTLQVKTVEYREPRPLVRLTDGEVVVSCYLPPGAVLQPGQAVEVSWDWSKVHPFDAATGQRLRDGSP